MRFIKSRISNKTKNDIDKSIKYNGKVYSEKEIKDILDYIQHRDFMNKLLKGEVKESEIDDYIEYWHNTPDIGFEESLKNFLGLTDEECTLYAVGRPLTEILMRRQSN